MDQLLTSWQEVKKMKEEESSWYQQIPWSKVAWYGGGGLLVIIVVGYL